MTDFRIRFYEWLAGKLLIRSAYLRIARLGPDDIHEVRHIPSRDPRRELLAVRLGPVSSRRSDAAAA
jgi:hypothetical protein